MCSPGRVSFAWGYLPGGCLPGLGPLKMLACGCSPGVFAQGSSPGVVCLGAAAWGSSPESARVRVFALFTLFDMCAWRRSPGLWMPKVFPSFALFVLIASPEGSSPRAVQLFRQGGGPWYSLGTFVFTRKRAAWVCAPSSFCSLCSPEYVSLTW